MIPPEIFPPWLQVILYVYVFPTIAIIGAIGFFIWWKFIVPKEARTLTWNRIFKSPLVAIATDDGFIDIERAKTFSEGVITPKKGSPYFLPRPIEQEFTELMKKSNPGNHNPSPMKAESIALKRYILRGTGAPLYLKHASKALLVNPLTLLGLKEDEEGKLLELKPKLSAQEAVKFATSKIVKVLLPLDPSAIKKWFPALWNESQIDSYGMRKEQIGYQRGKGEFKRLLIPIVLIIAIFVIGMIFLMVAGQGGAPA